MTTLRRSSALATNALNADLSAPRRSQLSEASYNQPLDWNVPPSAGWEQLRGLAGEIKRVRGAIRDALGAEGGKRVVAVALRPPMAVMERKVEDAAEAKFGFVGRFALTCESPEALAVVLPLPGMVFMAMIHVIVLRSGYVCTGSDTAEGEVFDQLEAWPEVLPYGWVNDDGTDFSFRYRPKAGAVDKLVLVGKMKGDVMTITAYDPITFIGCEPLPFKMTQYVLSQPGEVPRVSRDMEHVAQVTMREKLLNLDQWRRKHVPVVRRRAVPAELQASSAAGPGERSGGGSGSKKGKSRLEQLRAAWGGSGAAAAAAAAAAAPPSPKQLANKRELEGVIPRGRVDSLRKEYASSSNAGGRSSASSMDGEDGGAEPTGRVRQGSFLKTPEEYAEEEKVSTTPQTPPATAPATPTPHPQQDDLLSSVVDGVDMEGILSKRTKAGTWHSRVFKLARGELIWLRSDNKSLNRLALRGAIVRDIRLGAKKAMFEILPLDGPPVMLAASGEVEKKEWVRVLSQAAGTNTEVAPHDTTMSKAKVALLVAGLTASAAAGNDKLAVPKKHQSGAPPSAVVVVRPDQTPCASCGSVVYKMEELLVNGKVMHRSCFTCAECHRVLNLAEYGTLGGKYFCRKHYQEANARAMPMPSRPAAIRRQSGVSSTSAAAAAAAAAAFTTGGGDERAASTSEEVPPQQPTSPIVPPSTTSSSALTTATATAAPLPLRKSRRFSFTRLFSSGTNNTLQSPSSTALTLSGGPSTIAAAPSASTATTGGGPLDGDGDGSPRLSPALSHHSLSRPRISSDKRRPSNIPKPEQLLSDAKSLKDLAGTSDLADHPFTFRLAVDGNPVGKQVLWLHASSKVEAEHWQQVLVAAIVALDLRRVLAAAPSGPRAAQLKQDLDNFLARSEIEYEGFLDKLSFRSATMKNWKRRYVKLNGKGELSYSEDDNSKKPKNVVKLSFESKVLDARGEVANAPKEV